MFTPFGSLKILRFLTDFWTILLFALLVAHLFSPEKFAPLVSPVSIIYVTILGLFVGTKEFQRWQDSHFKQRLGEIYVIGWTVLLFALLILGFFEPRQYEIAPEVVATYLSLMSMFALSRQSKAWYLRRRKP